MTSARWIFCWRQHRDVGAVIAAPVDFLYVLGAIIVVSVQSVARRVTQIVLSR